MTRRHWIVLLLIWAAFLVRGLFYSAALPLWEGWDEYSHFAFVQHLQLGRGLPAADERISAEMARSLELAPLPWGLEKPAPHMRHDEFWLLPASERLERAQALKAIPGELQRQPAGEAMYEGKQPPAYYWLASIVLRSFSERSIVARAFAIRLFSVLLASSVVFLSFACAMRLFGNAPAALQVAALITAMPQLFMDVARVSNEPLAIALYSLLTYFLLLAVTGRVSALFYAELTLGAGFLTKAYFVGAVPAVAAAAAIVLWKERADRLKLAWRILGAGLAGLAVCGWWYVDRLSAASGPIWDDAAPFLGQSWAETAQTLVAMEWGRAIDFTLYSHIWLGAWSVMQLRSWMYHVVMYGIALGLVGLGVFFIRAKRAPQGRAVATAVVAVLYGGFWAALLYHAFVSFSRLRPPASGGWYLFAAIVPEVLIVVTGFWQIVPMRWKSGLLTAFTGLFVILDLYATHFVSIPYYAGIVRHRPDGGMPSFHISDAAGIGWQEVVSRMVLNKPDWITPAVLVALWVVFLAATLVLPFLSGTAYRRIRSPGFLANTPGSDRKGGTITNS